MSVFVHPPHTTYHHKKIVISNITSLSQRTALNISTWVSFRATNYYVIGYHRTFLLSVVPFAYCLRLDPHPFGLSPGGSVSVHILAFCGLRFQIIEATRSRRVMSTKSYPFTLTLSLPFVTNVRMTVISL